VAGDTTIGKVEALIREAESTKTQRQELIEQSRGYYVPVVLMVAGLVWFFTAKSTTSWSAGGGDPRDHRARRDLPRRAADLASRRRWWRRSPPPPAGHHDQADADARGRRRGGHGRLDKTGTLTTGKFAVSRLAPAEGVDGADAAPGRGRRGAVVQPPARPSILDTAPAGADHPRTPISGYEEIHGRGVKAVTARARSTPAARDWLRELNPDIGPSP
jgi:cation transport ATPase